MNIYTTSTIPDALIKKLRMAQRMTVLTGAGVSAESGVPTFREAQTGLWARYDPEELATPEAFQQNPALVWQWYAWRQDRVRQATPNKAHLALVEMEHHAATFLLITQNVDGLHHQAGSRSVLELHGNIFRTKCFDENRVVEQWPQTDKVPPHCPQCGGLLRLDIVWFGESLPEAALLTAQQAAASTDVFFSIGTSSLVYPAADLASLALRAGATVVEVNPKPTALSAYATFCLQGVAGVMLPALVKAVWGSE